MKSKRTFPRPPVPLLGGVSGGLPRRSLSIEAQVREAELGLAFLRYELEQQRKLMRKLYRRIEKHTA